MLAAVLLVCVASVLASCGPSSCITETAPGTKQLDSNQPGQRIVCFNEGGGDGKDHPEIREP